MSQEPARYRAGKRLWSEADDATLRAIYPDQPTPAIAEQLRRPLSSVYQRAQKLGLFKSDAYLASPAACRLRRGGGVGERTRYPKGHVPANKGLRRPGYSPGRMRETQFRKGERKGVAVRLWKPIGSERISKDGYLERKVHDDNPEGISREEANRRRQRRWVAVHRIVWEEAHGPIPPGHRIAFKNGDKTDIRIGNLECVSHADVMKRNTLHNLPPELAHTYQLLGALNRQIRKRDNHAGEKQD